MPIFSAITQHPNSIQAAGEISGRLLESLSFNPDILINFITPTYGSDINNIVKSIAQLTNAGSTITCISEGIIGPSQEVELGPGITSMAIEKDNVLVADLSLFSKLSLHDKEHYSEWMSFTNAWREALGGEFNFMLLLADPFLFDIESYILWHETNLPQVSIIGSLMHGNNSKDLRLFNGTELNSSAAIALIFSGSSNISSYYSYSYAPVGEPFTVTNSEYSEIKTVGNKRPMDYLLRLATTKLSKNQIKLVNNGMLKLGKVINDSKLNYLPNDFIPMDIVGVKQDIGSLIVESSVEIGSTVQFLLDDPEAASHDLRSLLGTHKSEAAIVFPNISRGRAFFGKPHQDSLIISESISPKAVIGHFSKLPFCYSNNSLQQSKDSIAVAVIG